ncbi:unnamed protein product [Notodromas monacha]|uniref:T-box domain-containing protein n=1 Tax=Notodromas monacha TaxID=399045 RepID=A0A7R9BIX4_9CRUS|nr:unnamed protein product [Notodromas monacha]CAG0916357.1 unnamed protein product [Notodromas monacha]
MLQQHLPGFYSPADCHFHHQHHNPYHHHHHQPPIARSPMKEMEACLLSAGKDKATGEYHSAFAQLHRVAETAADTEPEADVCTSDDAASEPGTITDTTTTTTTNSSTSNAASSSCRRKPPPPQPPPPRRGPERKRGLASRRRRGSSSNTHVDDDDDMDNDEKCKEDSGTMADHPSLPLHPHLVNVNASLEMKALWDEFNELGTEMIVTKAGRILARLTGQDWPLVKLIVKMQQVFLAGGSQMLELRCFGT